MKFIFIFFLYLCFKQDVCFGQSKDSVHISTSVSSIEDRNVANTVDYILMKKISCILENYSNIFYFTDDDDEFKLVYAIHHDGVQLSCLELMNFKTRPDLNILSRIESEILFHLNFENSQWIEIANTWDKCTIYLQLDFSHSTNYNYINWVKFKQGKW